MLAYIDWTVHNIKFYTILIFCDLCVMQAQNECQSSELVKSYWIFHTQEELVLEVF